MTLLAIVAIHTAANEPPKVRQVMNKIHRNVEVETAQQNVELTMLRKFKEEATLQTPSSLDSSNFHQLF